MLRRLFNYIWGKFLTIFGEIHVSRYPFWCMYDPVYFKMTGSKILEIAELVKPGDIILRGYDGYADTYFIPKTKEHGRYSHAGIYIGNNKLIHAVSPKVEEINIIDFCECDRIAIVRPKRASKASIRKVLRKAKDFLERNTPYDFSFKLGTDCVYCFELCAESYAGIVDVPKQNASILLGLIKRKDCYLAESFFEAPQMKCVFEYNPSKKIDIAIYA